MRSCASVVAARAWASVQASSSSTRCGSVPSGASPGWKSAARRHRASGRYWTMMPPARQARPPRHGLADRKAHQGRDLLRTLEVMMRRSLEALPFERDDALIAVHLAARIDGERHWPRPSRSSPGGRSRASPCRTGERAQVRGRVEIDQQHVDWTVALRLQLKRPSISGSAERRGERHRLRDQLRHGSG